MIFTAFEFTENITSSNWLASGTLPVLTLEATIEPGPGFDITSPVITSEALNLTGEVATVSQTIVAATLEGTIIIEPHIMETLPALSSWTIDGWISTGSTLDEAVPVLDCDSTIISGELATFAATAPVIMVEAASGADARLDVPAITVEATLAAGRTATCDLALPLPTVEATSVETLVYAVDASLVAPSLTAQVEPGNTATVALILPVTTLSAAGLSGSVLTLLETLPLLECAAEHSADRAYTFDVSLPALQLVAEAVSTLTETVATVAGYPAQAWVLNLRNEGLTEYTNWAFNSMTYFNGKYLGAGDAGVFELGVQDHEDNTTDIPARARTGKHDMDSSFLKRMPYGYLECEADGDVVVSTITSEDGQRDYLVPWNGNDEVQNRRIKFGRGPKSKHWQFEFANHDGSHFRITTLDSLPRRSHRRVQ